MAENNLFNLLNLNPYDEEERKLLNVDAIIKEVQNDPRSVELHYTFSHGKRCLPLHQALRLKAPLSVIETLCSSVALKQRDNHGDNVLHLAASHMASVNVMKLLLEKHPHAVEERGSSDCTPLHEACANQAPIEVIALLVNNWPGALKEKDHDGYTPLHLACFEEASMEMVSLMVKSFPDALKEKDNDGRTPLHIACAEQAPMELVSLVVNNWRSALKEKDRDGCTPLHVSCAKRAPWEVITTLLDGLPEAITERNNNGETPAILAEAYNAPQISQKLVSYVSRLFDGGISNPLVVEILSFFTEIQWWNGVTIALNKHPAVAQIVHIKTMPNFLCLVGRCCKMKTMWKMLCSKQDLFKDI
uniref:Uncharacterized protein n=1 Tax=Ditylum brightwellii TaxID=49249 RepID=A0A6U3R3R8_9STRA|mmetsp:Transcript_29039/g.38695  ORF Transcript_29039/g.38695 Transcript_29039/m.38695 type:complete len:360 (-) Transcript_29039:57-1136(-)